VCTLHEHKADVNECSEKLIQVLELSNFMGTLNPIEFTTSTSKGLKKTLTQTGGDYAKSESCVW
jgi:hypothetical protein